MKLGPFTVTRDSFVLWLPVLGAGVTYLIASPPPSAWTYYDWLRAAAAVIAACSTKLMTSSLPGKGEATRVDLTKIAPLVLLVVAVGAASGCAISASQKQRAAVGSTALYTAIAAVDDVEMELFHGGQISAAQHASLNPKIVTLLKAGKAANAAVLAWPQGTAVPAELATAVHQLGAVAHDVAALLPDGATKARLQTAIIVAQQAIALAIAVSPIGGSHEQENHPAVRSDRRGAPADWRGGNDPGRAYGARVLA